MPELTESSGNSTTYEQDIWSTRASAVYLLGLGDLELSRTNLYMISMLG